VADAAKAVAMFRNLLGLTGTITSELFPPTSPASIYVIQQQIEHLAPFVRLFAMPTA
jgi:hypothetical protein